MKGPLFCLLLAGLLAPGLAENRPAFTRPATLETTNMIRDKTLVVWCQPDAIADSTGGGGVLTLQEGGRFDSIVLGEKKAGVWMAGSEMFHRTQDDQSASLPAADAGQMVQIAVAYQGNQVKVFRNGATYAEYTVPKPEAFGASSEVLMGWRHFGAGPGSFFSGQIDEARIYDRALDAKTLAALKPGQTGSPAPLAMWTFEKGSLEDSLGRFGKGRLHGQAEIRDGRLYLDGNGDYFAVKAMPTRFEPTLHFRPEGGSAGDAIPYYHAGKYHLFYLRSKSWAHLVSENLVNWTELPPAIRIDETDPLGPDAEECWTGSIVEKDGTFHLFYTGKNMRDPRGDQKVMVATSRDLIQWTKQPDRTFYADGKIYWSKPVNGPIDAVNYHHQAFRDPAVFWNEEAKEWWMLLHAIQADGSAPAMGLYTSKDLVKWNAREPLMTYAMALSGDCPDIFELNGSWYILNGNYEFTWAPELAGPWDQGFAPYDCGDLRVAKTMFDGKRRILVGWVGDYAEDRDAGAPQWGGHLSMPREIYAFAPGKLGQRPVADVVAAFSRPVATLPDGPPPAEPLSLPRDFLLQTTLTQASPDAQAEIIFRRPKDSREGGYHLRVDFAKRTIELGGRHKQHRQVCEFDPSQPLEIRLFAIGTIVEAFVNDRYAFTMRAYDFYGPSMQVRAEKGTFQIQKTSVQAQDKPPTSRKD